MIVAALSLVAITVLIHGFGILFLLQGLRKIWKDKWSDTSLYRFQFMLAGVGVLLFLLHLFESAVWAAFYRWSDAIPNFTDALYFSVCSYTTVGCGDVLLDDRWRILGAFEACIGVLMLGWSTGIIFAMVSRQFALHVNPSENVVQPSGNR